MRGFGLLIGGVEGSGFGSGHSGSKGPRGPPAQQKLKLGISDWGGGGFRFRV